jgi:hypothetical protein
VKLLSILALGRDRFTAAFDKGTFEVTVKSYPNGIRGVTSEDPGFWAMLNGGPWEERLAYAAEKDKLIREALALGEGGAVLFE